MGRLSEGRGNVIRQVEMLRELGAKTGKSMPANISDNQQLEEAEIDKESEPDAED